MLHVELNYVLLLAGRNRTGVAFKSEIYDSAVAVNHFYSCATSVPWDSVKTIQKFWANYSEPRELCEVSFLRAPILDCYSNPWKKLSWYTGCNPQRNFNGKVDATLKGTSVVGL